MARSRKSRDGVAESKSPGALPGIPWKIEVLPGALNLSGLAPDSDGYANAEARELTRMASVGAGGTCVIYRRPPEIAPEVHAEIRRLFLGAGARDAAELLAYCLDREAADVIAEIVHDVAKSDSA